MGKGDRRSRRGKLFRGTHGKTRLQRSRKTLPKTKPAEKPPVS